MDSTQSASHAPTAPLDVDPATNVVTGLDEAPTADLVAIRERLREQAARGTGEITPESADRFRALVERQSEFARRNLSENTLRAYAGDQMRYGRWCELHGVPPLPVRPDVVAMYVTDLADQVTETGQKRYKIASLRRVVASIARLNYDEGDGRGLGDHALVSSTISGIARERGNPTDVQRKRGVKPEKREPRRALVRQDIADIIDAMDHSTWPAGVTAARDTLMILIGFSMALRRENVAQLTVENFTVTDKGIVAWIGKSKTDQEGEGSKLAVAFGTHPKTCVPCAWWRWASLMAAETLEERMRLVLATPSNPDDWTHVCHSTWPELPGETPVIARISKGGTIVRRAISGASLYQRLIVRVDAARRHFGDERPGKFLAGQYGFHSLRSGFVTEALARGSSHAAIRSQTLHKSDRMVDHYRREEDPLKGNAVTNIGL